MKLIITSLVLTCTVVLQAEAQSRNISAANSWSSSYAHPSPTERNVRLNYAVEQEKLKRGFYAPARTTVNNYVTNNNDNSSDHSVSNNVTAAEGAAVDLENRTAEDTGTSSTVIGALNESTTSITTRGTGNTIDVGNAADSNGCIDGSITSSATRPVGGFDISSGHAGSGTGSSSVSVSRGDCP